MKFMIVYLTLLLSLRILSADGIFIMRVRMIWTKMQFQWNMI